MLAVDAPEGATFHRRGRVEANVQLWERLVLQRPSVSIPLVPVSSWHKMFDQLIRANAAIVFVLRKGGDFQHSGVVGSQRVCLSDFKTSDFKKLQ